MIQQCLVPIVVTEPRMELNILYYIISPYKSDILLDYYYEKASYETSESQ